MAEENTSKRAAAKAEIEAAGETVKNWSERQKLHALAQLLRDGELKKAPLEDAFEAWNERQDKKTKERLDWLCSAFAKRYQRIEKDGTVSPRAREATTQQVVERLVAFALSASERDRKVEQDLGLFEYTADEITNAALLALSDRVYAQRVRVEGYNQAQALLRKLAKEHGDLTVDGTPLIELVGTVQAGLKTVGEKEDLGLPQKVVGMRTAKEEADYQKRFAAYVKGLSTKAEGLKAEAAAKALGVKGA